MFDRLVEFIYDGDFFPRQAKHPHVLTLVCESYVQRILPESKKEKYKSEWHDMGLACGTFTSTAGTHEAFKTAVLVLCLGERYGMQDLVDLCVEKLSCLPIGTKEVSTLAKYVLKEVPESNHVVYGFLQENISLFRPRLPQCEAFQELQKSSDLLLLQGLLRLTTPNEPPTFELEDPTYWGGPQWPFRFAICKSKVTLGDPIANFGSDTPPNANPTPSRFTPERTLYGAALKGEILVTFGKCDKRGIFLGGNPLINDGCFHNWLAYPTSCFELLNGLS